MSERKDDEGPPPGSPAAAHAIPAMPAMPADAGGRRAGLDAARVVTAVAALALVNAFFYPAMHDALDRDDRILRLARDGRSVPVAPPIVPRVHLSINATPRDATVLIDGAMAGTSPMMTSVSCDEGQTIRVEISARGYQPYVDEVRCLPGKTIEVSPILERDNAAR